MVVVATAATAWSSTASANNSRVSIADFQWSNKTPHIDLGESVIWTWTGPDTNHSVTGRAPTDNPFDPITTDDASQWDSDPGNEPNHEPGEEFKITFDHPGSYLFACKLHSVVRGVVTVSNDPGDPLSDPGPRPSINWDVDAPTVDDYFFTRDGTFPASPVIGPKGKGVGFRFSLGETGTASADYYVTQGALLFVERDAGVAGGPSPFKEDPGGRLVVGTGRSRGTGRAAAGLRGRSSRRSLRAWSRS